MRDFARKMKWITDALQREGAEFIKSRFGPAHQVMNFLGSKYVLQEVKMIGVPSIEFAVSMVNFGTPLSLCQKEEWTSALRI